MGKTRGPYKKYLYDENTKIPSRTLRDHNAKSKLSKLNSTLIGKENLNETGIVTNVFSKNKETQNHNESIEEAIETTNCDVIENDPNQSVQVY